MANDVICTLLNRGNPASHVNFSKPKIDMGYIHAKSIIWDLKKIYSIVQSSIDSVKIIWGLN